MIIRFAVVLLALLCAADGLVAGEAFFDSNGIKIRYLESGKGPAVILLHGFGMPSAEEMWVKNPIFEPKVIADLERDYHVIAMEFRGHGQSGKPVDPKQYGREMSEDVVRLMDHLKIKQAHVVGYSLGAAVSGKLLVDHPDRLLSVTFGGGAPIYKPSPKSVAIMLSVAESLERGDGVAPLFQLTHAGESAIPKEVADRLGQALIVGQNQKVLAAVVRGVADLEVTEDQLRANKVPALFLYGSREGEAKLRIQESKKVLTDAKTVVISNADHFNTFATPKFRKEIRVFLKAQQ